MFQGFRHWEPFLPNMICTMRVVRVDAEPSIPLLSFVVFFPQARYWFSHYFRHAVSCVKAKRVFGRAHFSLAGSEPHHHAYVSRTGCSFCRRRAREFQRIVCLLARHLFRFRRALSNSCQSSLCTVTTPRALARQAGAGGHRVQPSVQVHPWSASHDCV